MKNTLSSFSAALLTVASSMATAVTIDDFSVDHPLIFQNGPGTTATSVAAGVGGERSIEATVLAGAFLLVDVTGGTLSHAQSPGTTSTTNVQWDGMDMSPMLDPIGLGGVDLTDGGIHNAVAITLLFADLNAVLTFNIYTDGANASTYTLVLPGGANNQLLVLPYSDFTTLLGAGADPTNVGAIEMFIDGSTTAGLDVQVNLLETISTLTGSKDDALQNDVDMDGEPGTGDTIRYTIELENAGAANETNVVLTDTVDGNTSLVCPPVSIEQGVASTCNAGVGGDFQIDVGTMTPAQTVEVVFDVVVQSVPSGINLCNQGVINSDTTTNSLTFDLGNPVPDSETCWTTTPVELQMFQIE
ncbi:MAG: hypothetical protein DHS20C11_27010 [Lysobacteraceae bacterium]|nr:MAG: hypothetical protein DHS20C11_27010 [Xanthomonadaceae bacterium]